MAEVAQTQTPGLSKNELVGTRCLFLGDWGDVTPGPIVKQRSSYVVEVAVSSYNAEASLRLINNLPVRSEP